MTTTSAHRGWLVSALVAAVALLLGSVVMIVAWGGVSHHGAFGTTAVPDPGLVQVWRAHHDGNGMMDGQADEARQERRSDEHGHMRRGDGS